MTKSTAISKKVNLLAPDLLFQLNTPQLLKGGLYVSWGASLLFLVTTISGVQGQRNAIQTVGKDAVPSILNAQRIKDSLADMDANAANELLVEPGKNPAAIKGYEERRKKLSTLLVQVAENITYGDKEREPINIIIEGMGRYMEKIQRARDFNERGDSKGVLAAYREAAEIMDKTLLPAADELDEANREILETTYSNERFAAGRSLFFVFISGLLSISVLLSIQIFIYYRMRRILNPMLLVATAIATIFMGCTIQALLASSHHLKVAKDDSFKSLYALRKSRAFAYGANADESRYLLDKERAATHEQAFFNKIDKIVKVSNAQTLRSVIYNVAQGSKAIGLTGFMADALNNITFEGERTEAVATLQTFDIYFNLDKRIRQLEESGKHAEAIALCIGYNPGQSNWAFEEFKKAHQKFLDVNQKQFEAAIEEGFKDVQDFEITAAIATVIIGLLTLFGLKPRLKEYE